MFNSRLLASLGCRYVFQVNLEGIEEPLRYRSNKSGETVKYAFEGSQIIVCGRSDCHSGYAEFIIYDEIGELIHRSVIDFYSLVPDSNIRYVSPEFSQGNYILQVRVMGEHDVWSQKAGTRFGSDDDFVTLESVKICTEK